MAIGNILILRQGNDHFSYNRLCLYNIMTGKLANFPLSRLIFAGLASTDNGKFAAGEITGLAG
jgi:hypothetical protein